MNSLSDQLNEIALRKERLIARAAAQRTVVRLEFRDLEQPIGFVDRGMEVVRFLRNHPLLVAVLVGTLTVFRGRGHGLVALAGRALAVWRLWRSVSAWAAR
jgi:hypothetical protein